MKPHSSDRVLSLIMVLVFTACVSSARAAEDKPVQMEKFIVNDKHMLCFGVALTLWKDKNTGRVLAMYVKDVHPDSMAQKKGIRPGTRIWEIDNVPVENFEATFDPESDLGKKFLNRQKNDTILLDVTVIGERTSRPVVLEQDRLTVTVNLKDVNKGPSADWNWAPPKKD